MSDQGHAEETAASGGLLSSAWSMGAAAWNYASQTVNKYVVYACVVQFARLGRDCLSTVAWRTVLMDRGTGRKGIVCVLIRT